MTASRVVINVWLEPNVMLPFSLSTTGRLYPCAANGMTAEQWREATDALVKMGLKPPPFDCPVVIGVGNHGSLYPWADLVEEQAVAATIPPGTLGRPTGHGPDSIWHSEKPKKEEWVVVWGPGGSMSVNYYSGDGLWTQIIGNAKVFPSEKEANTKASHLGAMIRARKLGCRWKIVAQGAGQAQYGLDTKGEWKSDGVDLRYFDSRDEANKTSISLGHYGATVEEERYLL